ncbi:hypothetical protein P4O66_013403 [Electrophorus voltai]|uniref:Uncharacterized protein n=1 Tax=Electrophorus voltai TaxID=2609070 RepID=A0AAD8Z2R6_9TELE|nr:hypothetical protein P4O66_013403 [Electrophorus voltai]
MTGEHNEGWRYETYKTSNGAQYGKQGPPRAERGQLTGTPEAGVTLGPGQDLVPPGKQHRQREDQGPGLEQEQKQEW